EVTWMAQGRLDRQRHFQPLGPRRLHRGRHDVQGRHVLRARQRQRDRLRRPAPSPGAQDTGGRALHRHAILPVRRPILPQGGRRVRQAVRGQDSRRRRGRRWCRGDPRRHARRHDGLARGERHGEAGRDGLVSAPAPRPCSPLLPS
ncbi:unnamed protein product, partial [Prorocentrum cordatum]